MGLLYCIYPLNDEMKGARKSRVAERESRLKIEFSHSLSRFIFESKWESVPPAVKVRSPCARECQGRREGARRELTRVNLGKSSTAYEPLLLENEREAVADLLQYLESESFPPLLVPSQTRN